MKITRHGYRRLSERTSFTPSQKNHNVNQAWKYGKKLSAFIDPFFSYLLTKQHYGEKTSVKVYDGFIYVFDNRYHKLITSYPVPEEYIPTKKYEGSEACPCVILVDDSWYVSEDGEERTVFHSKQKAYNFILNNSNLEGHRVVVIPIEG